MEIGRLNDSGRSSIMKGLARTMRSPSCCSMGVSSGMDVNRFIRESSVIPNLDRASVQRGSRFTTSFNREMTWNLIENKDGFATAKKGLGEIAKQVNKLLEKAKTPDERRAVLKAFSKGVAEGLQKTQPKPR